MSSSKVYSGVTYSSPSVGTTNFALTSDAGNAIEYLSQDHIKVESSIDAGVTWTELTVTTDYTFTSNGTEIVLATPTVEDQQIRITRNTPLSAQYVTFSDGSLLTSKQLNKAEQFSLFCDQEIADGSVNFDPSDIGLDDTDDLPEGDVNLYYTDARVEAWIGANLADTDYLTEGSTNLYYTDARVEAWVNANLADTDSLPEGSINLYYTDARVEAWVNANLADTDDLAEGSTNLYYTDERVEAYVSGQGYIKDAGVTKIVAGSNLAIAPESGTGVVTINALGGGGGGSGLNYKGLIDATGPAPDMVDVGDLYINTAQSGVIGDEWAGIAGTEVIGDERLLFNADGEWDLLAIPKSDTPTLNAVLQKGNTSSLGATFGGEIRAGSSVDTESHSYLAASGWVRAKRMDDPIVSNRHLFKGSNKDGDVAEIFMDGSATFASGVAINSDRDFGTYIGQGIGGAANAGFLITTSSMSDGTVDVSYIGEATSLPLSAYLKAVRIYRC